MSTTSGTTVQVELNGATIDVRVGVSLAELLESRGVIRRMVAVEYNGEILPRHAWDDTRIQAGDVLEVVQMVGGG